MAEGKDEPRPARLLSVEERVRGVLERIRPYIQMDGGDVELDRVDEEAGVVYIRMRGACHGCPSSAVTLHMGIENEIRIECPEIRQVVQV